MTDQEALLRAIEASPDEDMPRLAYADWLDENATSDSDRIRAEYIRVHCELTRAESHDPQWADLHRRELELRPKAHRAWEAAIKEPSWHFSRGFPANMTFDAAKFTQEAARLARIMPLIKFRIEKAKSIVQELARCPALANVSSLSFGPNSKLGATGLAKLFRSPYLEKLNRLSFEGLDLGITAAGALTKANMPNLRHFEFTARPFNEASMGVLAIGGFLGRLHSFKCAAAQLSLTAIRSLANARNLSLTELDLSCNRTMSAEGIEVLAAAPALTSLRHFRLCASCAEGGPDVCQSLVDSPHLVSLQTLDLGNNEVGDNTAKAFAKVHRPALRTLELADNAITHDGLAALANAGTLSGLRKLNLQNSPAIGAEGVRTLAEAEGLPALEYLNISRSGLTCFSGYGRQAARGHLEAFAEFIHSPFVERLKRLEIARANLGRAGTILIAESKAVRGLTSLELGHNLIDSTGVIALALSANLANLRSLALCDLVEESAARTIIDSPHMRNLVRLEIAIRQPSQGCLDALQARFGAGLTLHQGG
jgi:uncharacterized protein (TIGR02996 family)